MAKKTNTEDKDLMEAEELNFEEVDQMAHESIPDEVSDSEFEAFKEYVGEKPYIVFKKKDLLHMISLMGYHERMGFDIYTTSFKLDMSDLETNKAHLVYNNKLTLAKSSIDVIHKQGVFKSCVASVNTLTKIFKNSETQVFLFEDGSAIYGYLYGGKVFIETASVAEDIYSKEALIDMIDTKEKAHCDVEPEFIQTLEAINALVRQGSRVEERAVYLEGGHMYIYAGALFGRFKGIKMNTVLQYMDMCSISLFLSDITEDFTIYEYERMYKFAYNGRSLYISRKEMKLGDDMKYTDTAVEAGVSVMSDEFKRVVNFLNNMQNNTGMTSLEPKDYGFDLVSFQKTMDYNSRFPMHCDVDKKKGGISEIRVPLDVLKLFIKIFEGEITLKTDINKLYVISKKGRITIYGNA